MEEKISKKMLALILAFAMILTNMAMPMAVFAGSSTHLVTFKVVDQQGEEVKSPKIEIKYIEEEYDDWTGFYEDVEYTLEPESGTTNVFKMNNYSEYNYVISAAGYITVKGTCGEDINGWTEAEETLEIQMAKNSPDATYLNKVKAAFEKEYGSLAIKTDASTDTNIKSVIGDLLGALKVDSQAVSGVNVDVKSTDTPENISMDGKITYLSPEKPNPYRATSETVACEFKFSKGTASVTTNPMNVRVGINRDYAQKKIKAEADSLVIENILGENDNKDEVTKNLALPRSFGSESYTRARWSEVEWKSSNEDVIKIDTSNAMSIKDNAIGVVTIPNDDTEVTITGTVKANTQWLDTYVDNAKNYTTYEKEFTVTVKGDGKAPTAEELQAILDKYYTVDLLTYFVGGEKVNTQKVNGDIQLPIYTRIKDEKQKLVFENKEITVTSSDENVVKINGYRANVDVFQNEPKTVNLTVSFTRGGTTVTKVIPLTIDVITDEMLDAEIVKMEYAKAHFFDGIKGENTKADSITENLHPFMEVRTTETGEYQWIYNANEKVGDGIIVDSFFNDKQSVEMESAGYNKYKSSKPAVITHENLLVQRGENSEEVKIESLLSSAKYGKYAEVHPDNAKLQKLYKQAVSVDLVVKGTKESGESGETLPPTPEVDKADPVNVTLTINNKGVLAKANDGSAMVEKAVVAEDINSDGKITYDEALVGAHKAYNSESGFGLGGKWVNKLWGVSTTNNLFFINGVGIPNGVTEDEIAEGDDLYASINADNVHYGDWYTFFNPTKVNVKVGENISLTLKGFQGMAPGVSAKSVINVAIGTWNNGSFQPIDGIKTDENGNAVISFDKAGTYLVTAFGNVQDRVQTGWGDNPTFVDTECPIMAPYCVITVSGESITPTPSQDEVNAKAVDEKIAAIGDVTLEKEETIKAARAAYDALTKEGKALVKNLDVLANAEAKLAELKEAEKPIEPEKPTEPEEPSLPKNPDGTEPKVEPQGEWKQDTDGKWEYDTAEGNKLHNEFAVIDNNLYSFDENGQMETGWKQIEGTDDYIFLHKTGGNAMKDWQEIDGRWYSFGDKDYSMKSEWQEIDGHKYYFHKKGGNMMTGWQLIDGQWFYFHLKGGNAMTGWQRINGKSYYFYEDGHMAANEVTPDGYKVDGNGVWQ